MSRYVKDFRMPSAPDVVFNAINDYLMAEGYEYTRYGEEDVFKKGKGLASGPTFIKLSLPDNTLRIEAWMKFAVVPGVYAGEYDLKSPVGAAVKGPLKNRVAYIEEIVMSYLDKDRLNEGDDEMATTFIDAEDLPFDAVPASLRQPTAPVQPQRVPVQPTAPVQPQRVPVQTTAPVQPQRVPVQTTAPVQPQRVPVQPTAPVQPQRVPVQPTAPVQPQHVPVQTTAPAQPPKAPAFCSHCGTARLPGAVYCTNCGHALNPTSLSGN